MTPMREGPRLERVWLPGRDEPLWLCCIATSDDGESRAGKVEVEGDLPRRKDI